MAGLTHQGHLDAFWANPVPPDKGVYQAFRRVLVERCLVRGGLASESAVEILVQSIIERLGTAEPSPVEPSMTLRVAEASQEAPSSSWRSGNRQAHPRPL
jgi:capsular polysaccharide export protein